MLTLDWVGPLELAPEQVARIPHGIPGIYMLHSLAISHGGYATFYVGKASDIRRRLGQHMSVRVAKPLISAVQSLHACFWSAAPVENDVLLAGVESGLIRELRPLCNSQIPAQRPILTNLPSLRLIDAFEQEFFL